MARNYIRLSDIINDIRSEITQDDYMKHRRKSDFIRWGKKALRELQYDTYRKIRSLKLDVNKDLNIVNLPIDYVDYTKIGILRGGRVVTLGINNKINISSDLLFDDEGIPLLDHNGQYLTSPTDSTEGFVPNGFDTSGFNSCHFYNGFTCGGNYGRLFGLGGGKNSIGEYRVDLDNNEIKLSISTGVDSIILEYISDDSMIDDPYVHVFLEKAIEEYIRWRSVRGLDNVPHYEKRESERLFIREKKKARARFNKFTKAEALQTIMKTFTLAPKTGSNLL